jgi:hypothetical protein
MHGPEMHVSRSYHLGGMYLALTELRNFLWETSMLTAIEMAEYPASDMVFPQVMAGLESAVQGGNLQPSWHEATSVESSLPACLRNCNCSCMTPKSLMGPGNWCGNAYTIMATMKRELFRSIKHPFWQQLYIFLGPVTAAQNPSSHQSATERSIPTLPIDLFIR